MKASRVAKLERRVRSRPCPVCGRLFDPPKTSKNGLDLARLSPAEQEELVTLMHVVLTPPCARCGRQGHSLAALSDEQLDRTLALLRILLGREMPVVGSTLGSAT